MARTVIALDVGGSSVKSGLVTEAREVRDRESRPVDSTGYAESILATFARTIDGHRRGVDDSELAGIAFGFPGPFEYETGVSRIANVAKYDALYGMDVGQAVRRKLDLGDVPIRFRNDAEAAILGECRYGAGRGRGRVLGVTLGTGLGSAFVRDGAVWSHQHDLPESGWLYAEPWRGAPADEAFSTRGLQRRLVRVANGETTRGEVAATKARAGDRRIARVFADFGADLGSFLRPYARRFAAEMVLVLGGFAGAFDLFGEELERAVGVPTATGELGADAPLLGAADLFFSTPAR